MADNRKPNPKTLKKQIKAYEGVYPCYELYKDVLKRVLEEACKTSFPEAVIQTRAKSISSFSGKAVRRFERFTDPVNQMDDLCGGRVIVQTTEQVRAVRRFIETNFCVVEKEDKGLLLGEQEFGYRDMHYIVRLRPERDKALKITRKERKAIDNRMAEIQVRTWVQHAWADTLHDRIYKNKMNISFDAKRTGNLLAALMEESDRNFSKLADELDGLIANYTALAPKKDVKEEIDIQERILKNDKNNIALTMGLARLLASCGDYKRVIELLEPHKSITDANQCELLLDLGYALCRVDRKSVSSQGYKSGRKNIEKALKLCESEEVPFVPNLRKRESLHARALSRLGWALEPIDIEKENARNCYRRAHEHEPNNPYYLAEMLGSEMRCGERLHLHENMSVVIREAAKTCASHAVAGIELPYSYFTCGRLNLFQGQPYEALGCYARGIRHCLDGNHCVPANVLDDEKDWLVAAYSREKMPPVFQYAIDLLSLGRQAARGSRSASRNATLKSPVVIIAGGAESMDVKTLIRIRPLLLAGLEDFSGTVIAGGTNVGVPGCVGDIALKLARKEKKQFDLIGYLPARIPPETSIHKGYDSITPVGERFSPDQLLRNWKDILKSKIAPKDVCLLGLGGGELSALEYRLALGLGAAVGLVDGLRGAAEDILNDPLWSSVPNLYRLPFDPTTVRAFVIPSDHPFKKTIQEEMARTFHAKYVANSASQLQASMKPWDDLDQTYKEANLQQAKYSVQILRACGFGLREAKGAPKIFKGFTNAEVKRMAEMEHGRWNIERLRNGWRYGKVRDNHKKIHNNLVPWDQLPAETKKYDLEAVRAFPEILAQAGLEVYRERRPR